MADESEHTIKRSSFEVNSQFQVVPKDMCECPKCFGLTEIDLTKRTDDGWPIGKGWPKRIVCDFCEGQGYVTPAKAAEAPTGCPHCRKADGHSATCPNHTRTAKEPPTIFVPTCWPVEEARSEPEPEARGWDNAPLEPGPVSYVEPVKAETKDTVSSGWAMFDEGKK
jgi:hypothetical protein